ncbi:hypothetical protein [Haloechinothrix salitolerans]|uniref:Uncharacterized protein n=1 Tax=Haloechinothrix salitolerans TaxID=926830 RepID=A0ABW2BY94_9PSEU
MRYHGRSFGTALPFHIGRHAHPKARPETPPEVPEPTGINYAHLIDAAYQAELAQGVNYAALTDTSNAPPRVTHDSDGSAETS